MVQLGRILTNIVGDADTAGAYLRPAIAGLGAGKPKGGLGAVTQGSATGLLNDSDAAKGQMGAASGGGGGDPRRGGPDPAAAGIKPWDDIRPVDDGRMPLDRGEVVKAGEEGYIDSRMEDGG